MVDILSRLHDPYATKRALGREVFDASRSSPAKTFVL